MTLPVFQSLPVAAQLLGLVLLLAAGFGCGLLYFRSLWWSARCFAEGTRLPSAIALTIGRFALLGAVLTLASLAGALPLLATAAGFLLARVHVMRRVTSVTVSRREGAPASTTPSPPPMTPSPPHWGGEGWGEVGSARLALPEKPPLDGPRVTVWDGTARTAAVRLEPLRTAANSERSPPHPNPLPPNGAERESLGTAP